MKYTILFLLVTITLADGLFGQNCQNKIEQAYKSVKDAIGGKNTIEIQSLVNSLIGPILSSCIKEVTLQQYLPQNCQKSIQESASLIMNILKRKNMIEIAINTKRLSLILKNQLNKNCPILNELGFKINFNQVSCLASLVESTQIIRNIFKYIQNRRIDTKILSQLINLLNSVKKCGDIQFQNVDQRRINNCKQSVMAFLQKQQVKNMNLQTSPQFIQQFYKMINRQCLRH